MFDVITVKVTVKLRLSLGESRVQISMKFLTSTVLLYNGNHTGSLKFDNRRLEKHCLV